MDSTAGYAEKSDISRPPVEMAVDRLQKNAAVLGEVLNQLESRLTTVLRPEGPEVSERREDCEVTAVAEPRSALVGVLADTEWSLLRLIKQVNVLMSRLEV